MIKKWKTLGTEYVYKSKRMKIREERLLLPDGKEAKYEIVEYPNFAGIIALTKENRIVFVKQYRPAVKEVTIEAPAGFIDKGEKPEEAALRELEEETGYRAGKLQKLAVYHSLVGRSNSMTHVFLATQLERSKPNPDEHEFLEVVEIDAREALHMVEKGKIKTAPSVAGIYGIFARGLTRQ